MADRPTVELLDGDGLETVGPEWAALWRCCPQATPFEAFEWLLPFLRSYAPDRCGATALRVGGRLQAILPVFSWEGSLMLAGTGPSDYGGCLIAPAAERWCGELLAALPDVPCGSFERIDLRQVRGESPLLTAAAPSGWSETCKEDDTCLVAPLQGDDGLAAASKSCRSNWRYAMRRIAAAGGETEMVPAREAAAATDDLVRLHQMRWREKGESSVFSDHLLGGFLKDAARDLAGAGLLRLHRLRFGATIAAMLFVLAGPRAHYYYIGGFDPAFGRFSPSSALIGAAMMQARSEGAREFDLLRGREPYKYRWGGRERATWRRTLTRAA